MHDLGLIVIGVIVGCAGWILFDILGSHAWAHVMAGGEHVDSRARMIASMTDSEIESLVDALVDELRSRPALAERVADA